MKKSLEQILKQCAVFAGNHSQIASFVTAPLTENTAKGLKYPLMFIDVQQMGVSFQRGQVVINLPVYMLDRLERDYSNLVSVLSSELLKIDDLYTWYTDNEMTFGFYFSDTTNATPVIYEFEDLVGGYSAVISVQVGNGRNENSIPFK